LLLFFLKKRAVLHNVVMFTTLETPRELFSVTIVGLAKIVLFRVLFGLLEELLEFSGEHGQLFFIKVRIILF